MRSSAQDLLLIACVAGTTLLGSRTVSVWTFDIGFPGYVLIRTRYRDLLLYLGAIWVFLPVEPWFICQRTHSVHARKVRQHHNGKDEV